MHRDFLITKKLETKLNKFIRREYTLIRNNCMQQQVIILAKVILNLSLYFSLRIVEENFSVILATGFFPLQERPKDMHVMNVSRNERIGEKLLILSLAKLPIRDHVLALFSSHVIGSNLPRDVVAPRRKTVSRSQTSLPVALFLSLFFFSPASLFSFLYALHFLLRTTG